MLICNKTQPDLIELLSKPLNQIIEYLRFKFLHVFFVSTLFLYANLCSFFCKCKKLKRLINFLHRNFSQVKVKFFNKSQLICLVYKFLISIQIYKQILFNIKKIKNNISLFKKHLFYFMLKTLNPVGTLILMTTLFLLKPVILRRTLILKRTLTDAHGRSFQ